MKAKEVAEYKVIKKENGRYAVRKRCGGYINGLEKIKILVGLKLIKTPIPSKEAAPPPPPASEAAPEAAEAKPEGKKGKKVAEEPAEAAGEGEAKE